MVVEGDEDRTALLFTEGELKIAAKNLKGDKAPGPDGILVEVLKFLVETRPNALLDVYIFISFTMEGANLTLIGKGKCDLTQLSAYRPLWRKYRKCVWN